MPTREAWTKDYIVEAPDNLVVRFSIPMVDQAATDSWPNTSTVSTKKIDVTCPAPLQGNKCKDCRACWDKSVFKCFATVNTKKFPRGISDPVISNPAARTATGACTGSGPSIWFFQDHCWKQRHDPSYKRQATSTKHHAPIFRKQQASIKLQAASVKLSNQPVQSPSDKHPILNNKRQASSPEVTSSVIREPRYMDIGEVLGVQGPRVFARIKVLCGCLI